MLEEKLLELAKDLTIGDIIKIVKYIKTYFIIPQDAKLEHVLAGIKKLKQMFDLPDDGQITPQVLRLTEYHRCGCPDSLELESATRDYNRWVPGMTLKWYIDRYVDGLTKDDQHAVYSTMFTRCSKLINLKFERVTNSNNANIVITASNRGNGLGSQNGTLAYAYLAPQRDFSGQLNAVFDLAEVWTGLNSTGRGIKLYNVGNHEICGHVLGLSHSSVKGALLYPYYSESIAELQPVDDQSRLLNLYGAAKDSPPIVPPTPIPVPSPPNGGIDNDEFEIIIKGKGDISAAKITNFRINKLN